jgi:hypothetical protein
MPVGNGMADSSIMRSDESATRAGLVSNATAANAARGCSVILFGGVPLLGLLAELMLGALSSELPMFPTVWHALAVVLAVIANLLLHLGMFRGPSNLVLRAVLIGFVMGMALLYGVAEAPALLLMLMMAFIGLGILAAAPYFALLGMTVLLPQLLRDWRQSSRSQLQLWTILIGLWLLPFAGSVTLQWQRSECLATMSLLANALENDGDAAEIARLAAELRTLDVATQRSVCAVGSLRAEGRLLFSRGDERFRHIGDGRSFWFLAAMEPAALSAESARQVFHCVHGESWDDGALPATVQSWVEGAELEWRSSRMAAQVERAAAIAKVEWHIEVASSAWRMAQAQFDLRLPVGAVASSLSLVIDGEPRPAAFAAASQVQKAFDSVVAKMRDPALLQEIGPGLLRLRLFPVSNRLPPMQVTIGFTMPLCLRGPDALLFLPQVVHHNCGMGRLGEHAIRIQGDGGEQEMQLDDDQLANAIVLPRGDANTYAVDADGFVLQELLPRQAVTSDDQPCIVVLDASASVGKRKRDLATILSGLAAASQPQRKCILFLVVGSAARRHEFELGSQALQSLLAEQAFVGGVDARNAITQALLAASAVGQGRIYWLHGAMAEWQNGSWPTFGERYELATLALHKGRNRLRDASQFDRHAVTVPRVGNSAEQLRQALQDFDRFHAIGAHVDLGDTERRWTRVPEKPDDAVQVSDQVARLWAARTARELVLAGKPEAAAKLAARYRLVTAGAGAVVLESKSQYEQHGLEPGAAIGREPDAAIGSLPVAEPSTLVLFGTGLLLLLLWRRRGAR